MIDVAVPRFPTARGAHYESFYLRAWDATIPRAIWIRYTTHRARGEQNRGALWVTAFEPDEVTAFRHDDVHAEPGSTGRWIAVGASSIREDPDRAIHVMGRADVDGHVARWNIALHPRRDPWLHLAPQILYRAPLPKTKSTSPAPYARATGEVELDGVVRTYEAGMLGHNWGSEHAHRWIWIHGADDRGNVIDLVGGRLKIAGRVLPWKISGLVQIDGVRRRVGGVTARAHVEATEERCRFAVSGIRGEVIAGPIARWVYDDSSGGAHAVTNASTSRLQVEVDGRTITLDAAAYELGVPTSDTGS